VPERTPYDKAGRLLQRGADSLCARHFAHAEIVGIISFRTTMLRVKNGACVPLRLSNMLSRPATGMTVISTIFGVPECALDASLLSIDLQSALYFCTSASAPRARMAVSSPTAVKMQPAFI